MPATPRSHIPPPPRPTSLLLLARWKESTHPSQRQSSEGQRHRYELAVLPDEPITVGRRVRVLAISPIAHCSPDVPPDQVDTYDPHIVGKEGDAAAEPDQMVTMAKTAKTGQEARQNYPRWRA
ncbi:hypothetical protein K466DRAFT_568889 [Polyporus arcularius HHB13444]|uniref:Uncharacterized protein n=1 Tax=Polyporus arcularius HHB13444 TaxID=1314778 RepID=A0A5C3NW04_9APHY|nr:hypothetical protein K466DRAFT_568889 [Polyporus arcularius HHB13444]